MAPVAASGGLLVLLLAGGCGKPAAAPEPVLPTITSSSPAAVTSIPAVANITVLPVPTTPPPTVAATTEPPPPPPPPPAPVQPQPEPPAPEPTTTVPDFDEVALEGFPCDEEGATAIDPAGRDLVCQQGRRNKLRWTRA